MKVLNWIFALCFVSIASSQTIKVPLKDLTHLDNGLGMIDVLKKYPVIQVKLPLIDTTGAKFIKFYSFWKTQKGPWVVIMILPKKNGEELYIDHNYNNDLSDDGPPHLFPKKDNKFIYTMVNNSDKKQFIRIALLRKPIASDEKKSLSMMLDNENNVIPKYVEQIKLSEQYPEFRGKYGSFYWIDRLTTHRGTVTLDGVKHTVGLHDWTYDGIYDDVDVRDGDRFFIDLKHSGKLDAFDPENYFSITDTFTVGSKNYRLKSVDRYGKWVEIETVVSDTTRHYKYTNVKMKVRNIKPQFAPFDTSWRLIAGETLDGKSIRLEDYRGKYVLLNFWGEWCSSCRLEIPALKNAIKNIPKSKLQIVSFVYSRSLEQSQKLIKDSSITWPQIPLSESLEEQYKISGYPTNILISPNGKEAVRVNMVNDKFFKYYIK